MVKNGKSKKNRLRVRRVVHVPLREVSGICLGRGDKDQKFLIAVGDRAAKIAWFSLSGSEEVQIDWHTRSIAKLSGSKLPKHNLKSRRSAPTAAGAFCCSRKRLRVSS